MSQENVEFTQRFIDHYNETGEFPWDSVDPDTVWVIDPAAWLGGTYRGHEGLRTLLGRLAEVFDQVRYEVEELIEVGDSVVVLGRMCVRGAQSGATTSQQLALVTQSRNGLLVAYRSYLRREDALEAVGLQE